MLKSQHKVTDVIFAFIGAVSSEASHESIVESVCHGEEEQTTEITVANCLVTDPPSPITDQFINDLLVDVIVNDQVQTINQQGNDTAATAGQSVSFAQLANESIKPKTCKPVKRLRQVQRAAVVISSPYKKSLEEMKKTAVEFHEKIKGNKRFSALARDNDKATDTEARTRSRPTTKNKLVLLKTGKGHSYKKKQESMSKDKSRDDCECLYCCELFSVTGGQWMQCTSCQKWAHIECVGISYSSKTFQCDVCWA